MSVKFDLIKDTEVEDAYRIEVAGYPADEAASLSVFQYRQSVASELFLGAFTLKDTRRTLIGYICSTLSPSETLTSDSMSTHVPDASSVCIHSVCVHPAHRRQGIALALLKEYLTRLQKSRRCERVLLITHEELRALYEKVGFEWAGQSSIVHGARPWFEMRKTLTPAAPLAPVAAVSMEEIMAQLAQSSRRSRPIARAFAVFPNGAQDLITDGGQGVLLNKFDLLCPHESCGSIILKAGNGTLVERASEQLEPTDRALPSYLPTLPAEPLMMNWWLVKPNAMVFENIGFSRPVASDTGGKRRKLLVCADCEIGPLGWCEEGGSEFWLACSRVGYRE